MTMWIARDKYGDLYLYSAKPNLDNGLWEVLSLAENEIFVDYEYSRLRHTAVEIDSRLYSEVTLENSPRELVIK